MIGQSGNVNTFEVGDTACDITVFLFLSYADNTGSAAAGRRVFPLAAAASARGDLTFNAYGVGLKTAATMTVSIGASCTTSTCVFKKADTEANANNFATGTEFALLASAYATLASDSTGSTGGVVSFKVLSANWGGSCCNSACPTDKPTGTGNGVDKCNLAAGTAGNKLGLFMINGNGQVAHSFTHKTDATTGSSKLNQLTKVVMTGLLDMPATTLTTLRGRGGFGASNQQLVDIFWQMTASGSGNNPVQMLLHLYTTVASASAKADSAMNVSYGFPTNTYKAITNANTNTRSNNNGIWAVGAMKIYVAASAVPLADYYGFFVPRFRPFFKSTGGNEIEVVLNSARTGVQCWAWGSENGEGFMIAQDAVAPQSATRQFTGNTPWFNTVRYSRMNMVICKVGVAAGTASTGDVMIIPTTQVDINGSGVNNPLPASPVATGTVTTLSNWNGLTATPEAVPAILAGYAIATTTAKYVSILAGTDANLGAMTFISNGDTNPATLMQAAPLTAADDTAPLNALATGATAYNTNAGASTTFDITPASADTANWLIGATKLTALLRTGQAAACTWTAARSVLTVCGDVAGSVIPTDLDMHSGTTVSGTKCTGAFLYTVITNASVGGVSTDTRNNRWCRWCNAALATNIVEVFIKDFVPPTTATKLLKGLVTWGQDTNGACQVTKPTRETKYQQKSVVIASGGCGKSGQTVKVSTKGQLVEFTIKSPVPLAEGQFVFWEEVTGTPVTFKPSSIPAGSVSCTCGTYTWAATFAKENITGTNDRMKLTIPNKATGATS